MKLENGDLFRSISDDVFFYYNGKFYSLTNNFMKEANLNKEMIHLDKIGKLKEDDANELRFRILFKIKQIEKEQEKVSKIDKFKEKILNLFNDVYIWIYNVISSIKYFWYWKNVIWNYRWWDYGFFLDILEKYLEDCEKHYGTHSHFVGDMITKIQIRECLYLLRKWQYGDWEDAKKLGINELELENYWKNLFFDKFSKLIMKLWD